MSYVNFCWFSLPRQQHPRPTALPAPSNLNNLAVWSEHLRNTDFLTVLWVNQAVYDEIISPEYGHTIITADKINPQWRKSYTNLKEQVGDDNVVFWQKRSPSNLYHTGCKNINVAVVNIQSFFKELSGPIDHFRIVLTIFRELLVSRYFAILKDNTVDFILSFLGGFYFDLDFLPAKSIPFFNNMEEVLALTNTNPEVTKPGTILLLLRTETGKIISDVGMKFNAGKTIELNEEMFGVKAKDLPREIVENFKRDVENNNKLIENTYYSKIKNSEVKEKIDYINMYRNSQSDFLTQITQENRVFTQEGNYKKPCFNINLFSIYYNLLSKLLKEKYQITHHLRGPEAQIWLKNFYMPFYNAHIKPKFFCEDLDLPSNYAYDGSNYIRTQSMALDVLGRSIRRHSSDEVKECFRTALANSKNKF